MGQLGHTNSVSSRLAPGGRANGSAPEPPKQENTGSLTYVLITPARNEAALIGETIQSVIAQTRRPAKWVIVSDGSTDDTDAVVAKYAAGHSWIELVRTPDRKERHFAGKVHAFNLGYARVQDTPYDVIGNLDADITFDPNYFACLLSRFAENPRLGVAGTPFQEENRQCVYRFVSAEHVSGACQLFRRNCFEEIGGYLPIKSGGIDLTAVITARMKGWQTRSFTDTTCFHHRAQGSAQHGALTGAFKGGRADFLLGCDPTWQVLRSLYRVVSSKPFLLNGAFCLAGYVWGKLCGEKRSIPPDVVRFRRMEERHRLRLLFKRTIFHSLRSSS